MMLELELQLRGPTSTPPAGAAPPMWVERRCLCKRPQQTTVAGNTRRFHVVPASAPVGIVGRNRRGSTTAEEAAAVRR